MPKLIPTWVWLLAIGLAFLIGAGLGYSYGTARRDAAAGKQVAQQLKTERAGAANTEGVRQAIARPAAAAAVKSEEATDAGQETIRVIYRDRTAPADCTPAPGVRAVLDAAHERASRAVRAAAGAPAAEVPERR